MIADAFDDGDGAGIAHREAFAGDAPEIALAGNGAVKHRIADDDVFIGLKQAFLWRINDQAAAGQPLADVVVGVAFELERDPTGQPGAEALPGVALHGNVDGVVGQALVAVTPCDLARQHGADGAVGVAHGDLDADRGLVFQRRAGFFDQIVIQGLFQAVLLFFAIEDGDLRPDVGLGEDTRKIEALGLPMVDGRPGVEPVHAPDHFIEGPKTELGHDLAHFLGDEGKEIDDVLRLADEALAQFLVLGSDPGRTRVEVALAHHDAALGNQGGGGKTEFVGPQQRPDDDVAPGAHAAVHLHRDAPAQPVQGQRLVGFGQAQFPERAGVHDRG